MADEDRARNGSVDRSRRALLVRLGLAAGTAYAAPVLLQIGHARASGSGGGSGALGRGPRHRRPKSSSPRPPQPISTASPKRASRFARAPGSAC